MVLGLECQAEKLGLDPEGLEERKQKVRSGYEADLTGVHVRWEEWARRRRDWRPSEK